MVNYRKGERVAVIHYLTHQASGGDGLAVVADGDDSGVLHRGNFGERFAFAAQRRCTDRPDTHAARGSRAVDDAASDGCVVVDRLSVGHAADGGETSTRGGACAGLDRLGHFLAGLAEMA